MAALRDRDSRLIGAPRRRFFAANFNDLHAE